MRPIILDQRVGKKFVWALVLVLLALIVLFLSVSAQNQQQYAPPTWPFQVYPGSVAFGGSTKMDYQDKHTGIDLLAPAGTPVFSSCSGKVIFWGNWQGSSGWINTIWVDCQDGNYFGYTHLDNIQPHANIGDQISVGQQIAVTGPIEKSGNGTDDHLHWMRSKTNPRSGLSWFFTNPTEGIDLTVAPQDQESGGGISESSIQQQSFSFAFAPVDNEQVQKPSFSSVVTATTTQPKSQTQLLAILAGVIVSAILLANHKPFGFFMACSLVAWIIFLAVPIYTKQNIAYAMDTAPRQVEEVEVNVIWQVTAPTLAPTPEPEKEPVVAEPDNSLSPNQAPPSPNGCPELSKFPLDVQRWCSWIIKYANQNGLEPALVAAMIYQESGGDPNAYSKSGATGLIQIMASDGLSSQKYPGMFNNRPTMAELRVPEFNIQYSTGMMRGLINEYGSLREALFHYGPIDVGYYYADLILNLTDTHKN